MSLGNMLGLNSFIATGFSLAGSGSNSVFIVSGISTVCDKSAGLTKDCVEEIEWEETEGDGVEFGEAVHGFKLLLSSAFISCKWHATQLQTGITWHKQPLTGLGTISNVSYKIY